MLDKDIEPDYDETAEVVARIIEDGFESGLADSFYDEDKFMEYLDEKYEDNYNAITNNGEHNEKWEEFLKEKLLTEDNRSDDFFNRYAKEYEDFVYDAVTEDNIDYDEEPIDPYDYDDLYHHRSEW